MKKSILTFIVAIVSIFAITSALPAPVFAGQCGTVETSIIECKEGEDGIEHILDLVIEIMSIGVGILGVVGITIVGIQYLTAGGSEEKTRKAKRRLVEILIGLALYAVMAALLTWLNVDRQEETSEIKLDTVAAVAE